MACSMNSRGFHRADVHGLSPSWLRIRGAPQPQVSDERRERPSPPEDDSRGTRHANGTSAADRPLKRDLGMSILPGDFLWPRWSGCAGVGREAKGIDDAGVQGQDQHRHQGSGPDGEPDRQPTAPEGVPKVLYLVLKDVGSSSEAHPLDEAGGTLAPVEGIWPPPDHRSHGELVIPVTSVAAGTTPTARGPRSTRGTSPVRQDCGSLLPARGQQRSTITRIRPGSAAAPAAPDPGHPGPGGEAWGPHALCGSPSLRGLWHPGPGRAGPEPPAGLAIGPDSGAGGTRAPSDAGRRMGAWHIGPARRGRGHTCAPGPVALAIGGLLILQASGNARRRFAPVLRSLRPAAPELAGSDVPHGVQEAHRTGRGRARGAAELAVRPLLATGGSYWCRFPRWPLV